jgi:hypothetical protein
MSRPLRHIRAGFVGLVLALCCQAASGQSDQDLARARELYNQGVTQEAAGDWAGALATFQNVAKLKMTPQVRFHIARCKEKLGRLNEALGGYRLAEHEATALGDKGAELLEEVQRAREDLEQRVPKLVIVRGEGAEAARIELDGVALGEAQIGSEISVDPGPHVVTGTLPGGRRFSRTIEVEERKTQELELDAPPDTAPATEPDGIAREPDGVSSSSEVEPSGSALPWIVGGIGLAGLAASAVFYKLKGDAEDELEQGCLGKTCPDTLEDTQSRGESYATLSGIALGVGVVGVGTAVVLLLTGQSPATQEAKRGFSIGVRPGARSAFVDLGARF